jgi:hypothetical protein
MANYCVVNDSTTFVVNRIVWDGVTPYNPGAGVTLVASEIGQIGDKYESSKFYYYDDWTDVKNISGATQANPVVISCSTHGFSNGDTVKIRDVVGMTELNNLEFTVANSALDTFELSGINGTGYAAYVSGGTSTKCVWTERT